ncbi:MAG TPA: hypothetical protein VEC56_04865 [Candidatus Krumholzibacteria bacterium]|nr:hypothetical protein [Candidatus Krumholzibacteria bacterium]
MGASVRIAAALLLIGIVAACDEDENPVDWDDNRAPILDAQPDTSVAYGDTLHLRASARDPDGDRLAYSMAVFASLSEVRTGYVAYARIDPGTGAFWFFPNPRDIPDRSFQFSVQDGRGGQDTVDFTVTVTTTELRATASSRTGTRSP